MKISEIKTIITGWSNEIIDVWFGGSGITNSLIKPAAKIAVKNYISKSDEFLKMFADEAGNIQIDELLEQYMLEAIPEKGLVIDPSEIAGANFLTKNISPKLLERSDIQKLKELLKYGSQINN